MVFEWQSGYIVFMVANIKVTEFLKRRILEVDWQAFEKCTNFPPIVASHISGWTRKFRMLPSLQK